MTDYKDCSRDLEQTAIDYRERINGLMFFANDEVGQFIPESLVKSFAERFFDGVEVAKEYDTPGWSAENAQREAQQAITALGNNGFAGIYAANDDTGGGAIAALKGAGLDPEKIPVTGQDATVAGLQRILVGQQYMTVFKEIGPEAKVSAEIALALAEGDPVPEDKVTEEVDNGAGKVPAVLLTPIAIVKDNVKKVVDTEFVSASELCTGPYEAACKEAGISG
jgi:D-xylose transport system substrate-binding protein